MKSESNITKETSLRKFSITFSDGSKLEIEKATLSEAFTSASEESKKRKMAFTFESNEPDRSK
jgi:hypothetical protein